MSILEYDVLTAWHSLGGPPDAQRPVVTRPSPPSRPGLGHQTRPARAEEETKTAGAAQCAP